MNASRQPDFQNLVGQPARVLRVTQGLAANLRSIWSWQRGLVLLAGTMAVLTSCSQGQLPSAPATPAAPAPTTPLALAQPAPQAQPAPSQPAPSQPAPAQPVPLNPGGWRDSFDGTTLDPTRWSPSTGQWAAFWTTNGLQGTFSPANLRLDGNGHLLMQLDVSRNATGSGFTATAAELVSNQKFGYGSYEVRMRAASTSGDPSQPGRAVSGNISAAFNYVSDSATEIDHEIEGQAPGLDWVGSWKSTATHHYQRVEAGLDLSQDFHVYRWDWTAGKVAFYIDGELRHMVTSEVPSEEAPLVLNLWPTNSENWGGMATVGRVYMVVDYAQFNPTATGTGTQSQTALAQTGVGVTDLAASTSETTGREPGQPAHTGRSNGAALVW